MVIKIHFFLTYVVKLRHVFMHCSNSILIFCLSHRQYVVIIWTCKLYIFYIVYLLITLREKIVFLLKKLILCFQKTNLLEIAFRCICLPCHVSQILPSCSLSGYGAPGLSWAASFVITNGPVRELLTSSKSCPCLSRSPFDT